MFFLSIFTQPKLCILQSYNRRQRYHIFFFFFDDGKVKCDDYGPLKSKSLTVQKRFIVTLVIFSHES